MYVEQGAEILNQVYGEIIGEENLVAKDLSNIVDVGRTITSSTEWGNNYDNYVKKIIDKVGLTLYGNKMFSSGGLGLLRYGQLWGSIVEKIRVSIGDYEENAAWQLPDGEADFSDIWDFAPVDITATYYNRAVTFSKKYSLARKQLASAFSSPAEMMRLFNAIEMALLSKFKVATNALEKFLVANRIAENAMEEGHPNVINILSAYNADMGETLTAAKALHDKDFLRYAVEKIGITRTLMYEESEIFNNTDFVTHSERGTLKMLFITDFAKALETSLYSGTFHDDYVKEEGYTEVGFWQGMGKTATFADRSKIMVKPASDNTKTVEQTGILCCLFSPDACFINGEQPVTEALPNPKGQFMNYWNSFTASFYTDLAENFVVFTIADPVVNPA